MSLLFKLNDFFIIIDRANEAKQKQKHFSTNQREFERFEGPHDQEWTGTQKQWDKLDNSYFYFFSTF